MAEVVNQTGTGNTGNNGNNPPPANADPLQTAPYHERYKAAREEIPVFYGKADYTATSFFTKVDRAADTYGIDPAHLVKLALSRIAGEACRFETDLRKEADSASLSYVDFQRKFHSRFPAAPEDAPSFVLMHHTRLGNGNMARYIQDFNKQASRAGPAEVAWKDMQEEIFLNGLGALRPLVVQARPEAGWTDIAALQSTAISVHASATLTKASKPSGSGSSSQPAGDKAKRPA